MKILALILTLSMLFGCCVCITGCGSNNDNASNEPQEIALTKDNFKNYFTIDIDSDIDITKHGGNYVLGVYVYPTYTASADIDVSVFTSVPLESYNVSVTLKIYAGKVYWNDKTISMNLSSSGSSNKSITLTTSDSKEILLESDCNTSFYASVVSVEGTIKLK